MSDKFKVGDIVRCVRVDDFYKDRLTIGEDYEVSDIDIHFPGKVVVRLGNIRDLFSEFVSQDFFMDPIAKEREDKINKILLK